MIIDELRKVMFVGTADDDLPGTYTSHKYLLILIEKEKKKPLY
jgi:hypothetical protein